MFSPTTYGTCVIATAASTRYPCELREHKWVQPTPLDDERTIAWIDQSCRPSTDYEFLPATSEARIYLKYGAYDAQTPGA